MFNEKDVVIYCDIGRNVGRTITSDDENVADSFRIFGNNTERFDDVLPFSVTQDYDYFSEIAVANLWYRGIEKAMSFDKNVPAGEKYREMLVTMHKYLPVINSFEKTIEESIVSGKPFKELALPKEFANDKIALSLQKSFSQKPYAIQALAEESMLASTGKRHEAKISKGKDGFTITAKPLENARIRDARDSMSGVRDLIQNGRTELAKKILTFAEVAKNYIVPDKMEDFFVNMSRRVESNIVVLAADLSPRNEGQVIIDMMYALKSKQANPDEVLSNGQRFPNAIYTLGFGVVPYLKDGEELIRSRMPKSMEYINKSFGNAEDYFNAYNGNDISLHDEKSKKVEKSSPQKKSASEGKKPGLLRKTANYIRKTANYVKGIDLSVPNDKGRDK